jgi:protease I
MKYTIIVIGLSMMFCGGGQTDEQTNITNQETPEIAKSVLMIIAPANFRDEEFKEPYTLLTEVGVSITVASTDTVAATGMLGMVVKPDIILDQVNVDSFDAVVVIGGSGCTKLYDNTVLHKILQQFNDQGKTIGAICLAPVILARAGILADKKATVYSSAKDDISKCGAQYTSHDVETDGTIITASGPQAANDFARTILKALRP